MITLLILGLQRYGFRPLEAVITAFVVVIGICYLGELCFAHPPLGTVAKHAVVPEFAGNESVLLAVGIIGATVMPHVIYLHSALTQNRIVPRNDDEAKRLFRYTRIDVLIAMVIAGLINIAMLVVAATVFFGSGLMNVDSLEGAHRTLEPILGGASSVLFALALTASGLSSSTVGTLSGQVVMQGFIQRQIPLFVRRLVTMIPAFVVIALGARPLAHARAQPGRALVRDPVRADPARDLHEPARRHGRAREPARRSRSDRRRALISAEHLPAGADLRRSIVPFLLPPEAPVVGATRRPARSSSRRDADRLRQGRPVWIGRARGSRAGRPGLPLIRTSKCRCAPKLWPVFPT